jgi:methionine synthase II (cobalamin-independent)
LIKRTVVGSFPRFSNDIKEAIKLAANFQLKNSIHIISDGEQRFDMINYFKQIPGLTGENKLYIGGKIKPMKNVDEFYKIVDFKILKNYLNKINRSDVSVKTAITGPVTLGLTCAINSVKYYSSIFDQEIYYDLSNALKPIIIRLLELNSFVQIDEPGISGGFMEPKKAIEILNYMLLDLTLNESELEKISIHMCSDLTRIPGLMDEILKLKVKTLSLAFSGNKEKKNINLINKEKFEFFNKTLGVGCVSVAAKNLNEVDSINKIFNLIKNVTIKIGLNNIAYFHPDCGLKEVSIDVAEEILYRFKIATEKLNSSKFPAG